MHAISRNFFLLFITFCMLGTVKIYIGGNFNWIISLALLVTALYFSLARKPILRQLQSLRMELRPYKPMLLGWFLFMAGIVLSATLHNGTGLYAVAKYFALLIVLLMLLLIGASNIQLEKALTLALIVSIIPLLLFVLFRNYDAMVIFGDGRMGWFAIWPGVLWKAGAYVWPYALWTCLKNPARRSYSLALLALLAMALDGSRTSMLWLAMAWMAVGAIGAYLRVPGRGVRVHATLLLIAAIVFGLIQPTLLNWAQGRYDRVVAATITSAKNYSSSLFASGPQQSGATPDTSLDFGSVASDISAQTTTLRMVNGDTTTRKEMLQAGWKRALETFPWGCGFGCTSIAESGEKIVIHMTYLQILADEGVISLVGYLLFMLYPLYRAIRYLTEKPEVFAERFDLMLTPVSILLLYLFIGFLHPLSNELTEWALVMGAISIVMLYVKRSD